MSKKNAQGIDVSADEERFLRSAFRRFAIPYFVGFAVIAWLASMLGGSDGEGVSPEVVAGLQSEVEALQTTVASLEAQLASVGADATKAATRVAALEKKSAANAAKGDDPGLSKKLSSATSRVSALERKLADQAIGERFDALTQRMAKLERASRAPSSTPAAPAPFQAAPSPLAPPTP